MNKCREVTDAEVQLVSPLFFLSQINRRKNYWIIILPLYNWLTAMILVLFAMRKTRGSMCASYHHIKWNNWIGLCIIISAHIISFMIVYLFSLLFLDDELLLFYAK